MNSDLFALESRRKTYQALHYFPHETNRKNTTRPVSHRQLPVNQVTEISEKHVSDGAEVLFCFIVAELHEDHLFVSDVLLAADHHGSFLWEPVRQ